MYLQNLKTREFSPFVYSLHYDPPSRTLQIKINPACIPVLQNIPTENICIQYCKKNLGFVDFEPDIEKNFGFHNCCINNGIVNGLLSLSFPITAKLTISKKKCFACHGKKKDWNNDPCYFCRGTGKELDRENNIHAICATLYVLMRYLNWQCIANEKTIIPENRWGLQDIFLELDPTAGIGGECSKEFFERIKEIPDDAEKDRQREMFELNNYLDGKEQFPAFKLYNKEYDFRSEIKSTGRIYVEVPGQNGCSIHMAHGSDTEITCHNVDTPYQQIGLIVGFALITNEFYTKRTL